MATPQTQSYEKLICSYLGISFAIFLGLLPKQQSLYLKNHNDSLSKKLLQAEQQLEQLYSRRKEDSKANARVVEIFASHRHGWQQEEKRLLRQIDENVELIENLRAKVEELEIRVDELKSERDELLNFITNDGGEFPLHDGEMLGSSNSNNNNVNNVMGMDCYIGMGMPHFSNSNFLPEISDLNWQQGESVEPVHDLKHYATRRESPWKVDGDSSGVSAKLKLLEQELQILENMGANDLSKLPSLMRKQARRYEALATKIDHLCRRMQENDPCEPNAGLEFRTQRQTEFLLEALRLQQRASETGQKLVALQAEAGGVGCSYGNGRLTTRLSLNSVRNSFRDIQRNLEIWLARIIGDVEGILARDGASRVSEYYISPRFPFVQQERF